MRHLRALALFAALAFLAVPVLARPSADLGRVEGAYDNSTSGLVFTGAEHAQVMYDLRQDLALGPSCRGIDCVVFDTAGKVGRAFACEDSSGRGLLEGAGPGTSLVVNSDHLAGNTFHHGLGKVEGTLRHEMTTLWIPRFFANEEGSSASTGPGTVRCSFG